MDVFVQVSLIAVFRHDVDVVDSLIHVVKLKQVWVITHLQDLDLVQQQRQKDVIVHSLNFDYLAKFKYKLP